VLRNVRERFQKKLRPANKFLLVQCKAAITEPSHLTWLGIFATFLGIRLAMILGLTKFSSEFLVKD
jgi:hypothetical protein